MTPETQLEIRSTPVEEMNLYPLDTFEYEYVGNRIEIEFTSSEFTAICRSRTSRTSPPAAAHPLRAGHSCIETEVAEALYQFCSAR